MRAGKRRAYSAVHDVEQDFYAAISVEAFKFAEHLQRVLIGFGPLGRPVAADRIEEFRSSVLSIRVSTTPGGTG